MQELAERSGLPRTTIHHYIRESLLPPAHKTAPNAAEYDEAHLERLRLITRLRGDDDGRAGGLSIPRIRRVLEHYEAGLSIRAAVRLTDEGVAPESIEGRNWTNLEDFASAAEVPPAYAERLASLGIVGGKADGSYDPGDLLVARSCHAVHEEWDVAPRDLAPIADLIREVGSYSTTLMDVHTATVGASGDADRRALRDRLAECSRAMLWRALES